MSNFGYFVSRLGNHGMGRALRHRDFSLYATAGWVSNVGLWIHRTAVFWLTWEMTHSFSMLGAMAFVDGISTILVMPYAGTLSDRFDRLALAKIVQLALIFICSLTTLLSLTDMITIKVLFLLVILNGIAEGFWTPLRMTIPPSLVPKKDLPPALGVSATLFNLAQFIGPALGGIIISSLSVTHAFAFNAVSYLAYLGVLFIIRFRYEEVIPHKPQGFITEFKEGLTYISKMPGLRGFLILSLGVSVLMRAYRELFAGISDGIFNMGVEGLAILSSASGLGAMITAIYLGSFTKIPGLIKTIMFVLLISIITQLIFATTNLFWISVTCAIILSGSATYAGIAGQLLIQNTIHGSVRGRVMSIWGVILRGGPAVGAWIIGTIAGYSNLQLALTLATVAFISIWIWVLPRTKDMAKNLERTAEEREADIA
jgi:MFS family permease